MAMGMYQNLKKDMNQISVKTGCLKMWIVDKRGVCRLEDRK